MSDEKDVCGERGIYVIWFHIKIGLCYSIYDVLELA